MTHIGTMRDGNMRDEVYLLEDGRIQVVWSGGYHGLERTVEELEECANRVMKRDVVAQEILDVYKGYLA